MGRPRDDHERYSFLSGSSMLLDILAVGDPGDSGPLLHCKQGGIYSLKTSQFGANHNARYRFRTQGTADCD
jgi:hypothetical protein